jgi:hypothetical protein
MKEAILRLEGLFVGQLNADELLLFDAAVTAGLAFRAYEGAAGFLGLAKVRLR